MTAMVDQRLTAPTSSATTTSTHATVDTNQPHYASNNTSPSNQHTHTHDHSAQSTQQQQQQSSTTGRQSLRQSSLGHNDLDHDLTLYPTDSRYDSCCNHARSRSLSRNNPSTLTQQMNSLSVRSQSHGHGLNDLLPDSLSLTDDLDNLPGPSQPVRQRSGFADVSHLVKQKLRRMSSASSGNLSDREAEIDSDDEGLAMPAPPQRQKSGYEVMKEKFKKAVTGECDKCAAGKACAVHKRGEKQKALLSTKSQKAHRKLPGFD